MILLGHQFWIVDPLAGIGISVWMLNLGRLVTGVFFWVLDPSRRRWILDPQIGGKWILPFFCFFPWGVVNLGFLTTWLMVF